jgi:glutathione S-transferase
MNAAHGSYTLYGWELSLYSGKARSYLRHRGVRFVERAPNAWHIFVTIPRRTGARAMPAIVDPHGIWVQDTSAIIDHVEAREGAAPLNPTTPRQRLASYLLELWGDEFWLPVAMHMRWSHAENYALFRDDAGRQALPGFPRLTQQALGAHLAGMMRAHLPKLGIAGHEALIDRWAAAQLDALDRHFAAHPYLFGSRPSYGDYGLMGPLYAHLGRDPWPRRHVIEPRVHLSAWLARMQRALVEPGAYVGDDAIADTLRPALRSVVDEMLPYLDATAGAVEAYAGAVPRPDGRALRVPRMLGRVAYPYAGATHQRCALPYGLWMLQRLRDMVAAMSPADSAQAIAWLRELGGAALIERPLPSLRRDGLSIVLQTP